LFFLTDIFNALAFEHISVS